MELDLNDDNSIRTFTREGHIVSEKNRSSMKTSWKYNTVDIYIHRDVINHSFINFLFYTTSLPWYFENLLMFEEIIKCMVSNLIFFITSLDNVGLLDFPTCCYHNNPQLLPSLFALQGIHS